MFDLTLTFDNGPDVETTPRVLDILRAYGIKSTFFVVGRKLAAPECRLIASRARAEGHWLGNHTYTHHVPLGLQPESDVVEREIKPVEHLLADMGETRRLFRPFGGGGGDGGILDTRLLKRSVVKYLVQHRYSCVLWDAIPRDWADPEGWVDCALEQISTQPRPLMVLHDIPSGAMRHLDRFLDQAAAMGTFFHQEFPDQCVPIRDGVIVSPLDQYISELD